MLQTYGVRVVTLRLRDGLDDRGLVVVVVVTVLSWSASQLLMPPSVVTQAVRGQ